MKNSPHRIASNGASNSVMPSLGASISSANTTIGTTLTCLSDIWQVTNFWQATEADNITPIRREIRVADLGKVYARLTDGFDILVSTPKNRHSMREALIARYFPGHAAVLLSAPQSEPEGPATHLLEEESIVYGRDPAFRRKIIAIYDHQCAACGLRIRLPQAKDISFIDAAHLVPFSESHNDHPTNGLALSKTITGPWIDT